MAYNRHTHSRRTGPKNPPVYGAGKQNYSGWGAGSSVTSSKPPPKPLVIPTSGPATQPSSSVVDAPPASGQVYASNAGPPVDPQLIAQQNAANLSIALGDTWDTYQKGRIDTSFGNVDNPAADAVSNPYSQAALAYKRYNEAQQGTTNNYAAAGQLYSGALQHAGEGNAFNYLRGLAALRQSRQDQLDSLTQGALGRYSQVGANISQDQLTSLTKALGLS